MKIRSLILIVVASLGMSKMNAQTVFDTLHTKVTSTYMYLNIAVPKGKIVVQSSKVCGASVARFASPNRSVKPQIQEDRNGNLTVLVGVARKTPPDELRAKSVAPASIGGNIQFKRQFSNLANLSSPSPKDFTTEFRPDPTLPTELHVNVGAGGSKLDLSGLNLYKASINSAFSDIWISYSRPNLCAMKKMDVHAAKAKIRIENIEYARAEFISIQNDMGETEIILNNHAQPGTTIYLSSGAGNCKLFIHENHPTKIVIRKGFFAKVEVDGDFEILDKSAFVNAAFYQPNAKYTTIICNIDFGKIFIQETAN